MDGKGQSSQRSRPLIVILIIDLTGDRGVELRDSKYRLHVDL